MPPTPSQDAAQRAAISPSLSTFGDEPMSNDQAYAFGNSPVASVDEAIERIDSLTSWLAPDDGMSPFNTMYLSVIKAIREATTTGYFTNSRFLDRLDVSFVNRYFDAYTRSATGVALPRCWDVLWTLRHSPHHVPLQFALAGMNAHINHDLVLALVETFTALDADPRDPALAADFARVNDLLGALEPDVRRTYEHGLLVPIARRAHHETSTCCHQAPVLAAAVAASTT